MTPFAHLDELGPLQVWDGVVARGVHGGRATLALVELDPGAVVPEHRHENEQLGLLLRGSLVFRIGELSEEITPGGSWSVPPNVPHAVHAGAEGAVAVEAFAPGRTDWHGLPAAAPERGRWP